MNKICDIILLSYESPDLLRKCVESVLRNVDVPSRLIVVDNASRDPVVKKYLEGLEGNSTVSVEKLFLEKNYGFAGGMNRGLALSGALHVLLLNNDCVLAKGALKEMIDILAKKNEIGLVNPQSNTFGSAPSKGVTVDEYAGALSAKKGKYAELGNAIGFACLIRRDVIEKVGYFDEAYKGVCYEDTDYSARAARAGYIAVLAEGAYVYHAEQASRRRLADGHKIYARNREIFEEKWGKILRVFYEGHDGRNYEKLKNLARQRVFIDMAVNKRPSPEIRHTDINFTAARRAASALKILTKKKKYDAVILEEGSSRLFLSFLARLRGAKVFMIRADGSLAGPGGRMFTLDNAGELAEYLRGK